MKGNIVKVFSTVACVFAFDCVQGMNSEEFSRKFAELNQKCSQILDKYGPSSEQGQRALKELIDFQKNDPNATQRQVEQRTRRQAERQAKRQAEWQAEWQAKWRAEWQAKWQAEWQDERQAKWQDEWAKRRRKEEKFNRKCMELNQKCSKMIDDFGLDSQQYEEALKAFRDFQNKDPNTAQEQDEWQDELEAEWLAKRLKSRMNGRMNWRLNGWLNGRKRMNI